MKLNLSKRIAVFVGILILVISGGLGTASIVLSSNTMLTEVENGLHETAKQGASLIEARLQVRTNVLSQVANRISTLKFNQQIETLSLEVEELGYLDMAVVDMKGTAHYVVSGEEADLSERDYIKKALGGEACFSNVLISKVTNSPVIMDAAPIKVKGEVIGALIGRRDGAALNEITDQMRYGENGYAYILSEEGTFFAHPDREFILTQRNVFKDIEENGALKNVGLALQELGMGNEGVIEYELNNTERIFAIEPIPGTNWVLGLGSSKSDALAGVNTLSKILLILSIVFVATGIALAIALGMSISKPIKHVVGIIDRMSRYDLIIAGNDKATKYSKRKDEIGIMSNAVLTLQDNLKELIKNVAITSEQLADSSQQLNSTSHQSARAAEEIARAIQEIAEGANDQAKDVEKGAIHIESLGSLVEKDSKFVNDLNETANAVDHLKDEGFEILEVLIEKTELNNKTSIGVRDMIIDTNESAGKIEAASQMIKSIANQTNLLALNAAIEAARAGEAGRGFAVVADEIRKLAEQSNGFTEEIALVIEELTKKTGNAVHTMEEVGKIVVSQAESVEKTHTKFEGISEAIEKMKISIKALNQSSSEMGNKKDEIVSVIQNLSAISQENAAGTEEASASIEEQTASMEQIANASDILARLAEEMQTSIAQFKY